MLRSCRLPDVLPRPQTPWRPSQAQRGGGRQTSEASNVGSVDSTVCSVSGQSRRHVAAVPRRVVQAWTYLEPIRERLVEDMFEKGD